MAKLKFNLLELTSKRVFLDKLMPSGTLPLNGNLNRDGDATLSLYDEWTNCQTRWSPTDVKELERQVEARKNDLKAAKERMLAVKQEIANGAEHVVSARDACEAVRRNGQIKIRELSGLTSEISAVEDALHALVAQREVARPSGLARCTSCEDIQASSEVGQLLGLRSVDELQEELDTVHATLRLRATTGAQRHRVTEELLRALAQQSAETSALESEGRRLTELLAAKQRRQEAGEGRGDALLPVSDTDALEQLCVWHRTALEAVADLTAMRFEMLRPDYLLVSIDAKGLALHLNLEPPTGKLLAARLHVGTSTALDEDAMKGWCARAVESNDITTLLHQLQQI